MRCTPAPTGPLVAEPRHAGYVHGESGLDGADLPDADDARSTAPTRSAFIIETCRPVDGIWLVPIGPLTNIALALRTRPDLAERIAGISLMGGGTFGNRTAAAEFNIWADPEAAAIVFGYGGPLVMAGLDVTHQFQATPERDRTARGRSPGRLAACSADLLVFFTDNYTRRHDAASQVPPCTTRCAVLALTHPELFTRALATCAVETRGELTRGMTVDRPAHASSSVPAPNCDVLTDVDADAGFDLLIDAIAHFVALTLDAQSGDLAYSRARMRAAVMRTGSCGSTTSPTRSPGRPGAHQGAGVRHLRQRPAPAAPRRRARRLADELADDRAPPTRCRRDPFEPDDDTVMGHEFCCEVVELGPGVEQPAVGDVVVSMPVAFDAAGIHAVGYSNRYPGGYAELMVLNELLAIKVPSGLPHRLAALTEPLAVGVHAVAKSRIAGGDARDRDRARPGRTGLHRRAEAARHRPDRRRRLLAARRALAEHLGADVVVDPAERARRSTRGGAVDGSKPLVMFEAVGVPGMIEQAMRMARRTPGSSSSASACRRTASSRCSASARS